MTDTSVASPAPDRLQARITIAAAIGAAALIGFGIILWIAANWDRLDKFGKFGLVAGAFTLGALAAMARPGLRIPGSLVAFCAIGGMFALFGQVYQSGADPWQLFALWAALGLPLALAARHDAIWVPWTLVTFTGIPLWMVTTIGTNAFAKPDPSASLPGWTLAAFLVAALFAINRRMAPAGQAIWAARLATIMAIGLVGSGAFGDVLNTQSSSGLYWLGIGLLAAGLVIAGIAKPLELALLVAAALAIDVLLITGIIRILFFNGKTRLDWGMLLTVFFCSALIIGGTATALLKWVNRASPTIAEGQPAPVAAASVRTWPITLLSGVGAVLTAIPLMVFFAIFLGEAFRSGPAIYIISTLLIGSAVAMLLHAPNLSFLQQFGFIGLVSGLIMGTGSLLRDLPHNLGATCGVMLVVTTGLAFVIRVSWIRSLLGAAAAICLASFLKSQLLGNDIEDLFREEIVAAMIVAACAAALLLAIGRNNNEHDGMLIPFTSGFTAAALAALIHSSGRTFLLGGRGMFESALSNKMVWSLANVAPPVAGVLATLAGAALLFQRRRDLLSPMALAITAAIAVFAAISPMLGFTALLLAICMVTARNVLALFAAFAALWIIGSFYYWLGWTLEHKGQFLIGLGAALALATLLTRRIRNSASLAEIPGLRSGLATGLIGLTAAATLGIFGVGIRQKEAILSSGRTVYLALAPVDPRSLMQGDYMALRFAMPNGPDSIRRPVAIATIDARNIATITRITLDTPAPAANEVTMKTRMSSRGWSVGTDAWFFPEGQGQKFEAAKFGEFRLGPAGDLILVGMADKDLTPIR